MNERESMKARTTKSARRDVNRVRGRKIDGDQGGGQLGRGHEGQAQEAVDSQCHPFISSAANPAT